MKSNLNEVWNLIDSLSFAEKKIIYKRMQNEINNKLFEIVDKINERAAMDPISLEDITKEVEDVRRKRYGRKIKIVVDTNIFISAFLGSKKARFLLKDIINDEYILIMSSEQLLEIKEVLNRPKFEKYISKAEIDELVELISLKAIMPAIYDKITDCRDEKDNMILEEAVYGNANYIITGDDDLLILNPYRWIKIVMLRDFLNELYDL